MSPRGHRAPPASPAAPRGSLRGRPRFPMPRRSPPARRVRRSVRPCPCAAVPEPGAAAVLALPPQPPPAACALFSSRGRPPPSRPPPPPPSPPHAPRRGGLARPRLRSASGGRRAALRAAAGLGAGLGSRRGRLESPLCALHLQSLQCPVSPRVTLGTPRHLLSSHVPPCHLLSTRAVPSPPLVTPCHFPPPHPGIGILPTQGHGDYRSPVRSSRCHRIPRGLPWIPSRRSNSAVTSHHSE